MPIRRIRARLGCKRCSFRLLPAPWQFDDNCFGAMSEKANRWKPAAAGSRIVMVHLPTRQEIRFRVGAIKAVRGRDVLLNVQIVLAGGRARLQPLPSGYWFPDDQPR